CYPWLLLSNLVVVDRAIERSAASAPAPRTCVNSGRGAYNFNRLFERIVGAASVSARGAVPAPSRSRLRRGRSVRTTNGEPAMFFEPSPRVKELQRRLLAFMDEHIYPSEKIYQEQIQADRWRPPPVVEELKARARAAGLWNLFLPPSALPLSP